LAAGRRREGGFGLSTNPRQPYGLPLQKRPGMTRRHHRYRVTVEWSGNRGQGTWGYNRAHILRSAGKPAIAGSADPAAWNPEELLLAAISACHKLWYLHLCSEAGIVVTRYTAEAEAVMEEDATGGGRFTSATLRPSVTVRAGGDTAKAMILHRDAHRYCFIANSVNFPIGCEPSVATGADP
jgi:organic hydroperoxide reductase OsmC/OhrA